MHASGSNRTDVRRLIFIRQCRVRIQLRHQQRKPYLHALKHKLQQETAKRIAAEAVMDPASELHKRLQIAAPVVAAGIVTSLNLLLTA